MNNNIPIYWHPHLPNIESRTDWIVVIVHTNVPEPHTASCWLILLHSFAASGIDQSQPAGRGVAPRHTTSYLLPIGHRLFAILLYSVVHISSFFWNLCIYILRSHCQCHLLLSSTSPSSPTMYHFGFSSLLLVAPFSGFRSSFSGYNF